MEQRLRRVQVLQNRLLHQRNLHFRRKRVHRVQLEQARPQKKGQEGRPRQVGERLGPTRLGQRRGSLRQPAQSEELRTEQLSGAVLRSLRQVGHEGRLGRVSQGLRKNLFRAAMRAQRRSGPVRDEAETCGGSGEEDPELHGEATREKAPKHATELSGGVSADFRAEGHVQDLHQRNDLRTQQRRKAGHQNLFGIAGSDGSALRENASKLHREPTTHPGSAQQENPPRAVFQQKGDHQLGSAQVGQR